MFGVVGTTLLAGCNNFDSAYHYSVSVQNASDQDIAGPVKVTFDKSTWSWEYGFVQKGTEAGYSSDRMPPPPLSFEITWNDASGRKQKTVSVPESVRNNITKSRKMQIVVMPNDDVTVQ